MACYRHTPGAQLPVCGNLLMPENIILINTTGVATIINHSLHSAAFAEYMRKQPSSTRIQCQIDVRCNIQAFALLCENFNQLITRREVIETIFHIRSARGQQKVNARNRVSESIELISHETRCCSHTASDRRRYHAMNNKSKSHYTIRVLCRRRCC